MENYKEILEIPSDTGYWLVRADGGRYYDDFLLNDFIAVSDNEITIELIEEHSSGSLVGSTHEHIKDLYCKIFSDWSSQQLAHAVSRTSKFIFDMKIGDLILVPSRNSKLFLLGIITSDVYQIMQEEIESKVEVKYSVNPYLKRRTVKWLKEIPRSDISEKLYWVLSAHQTIFNLEDNKEQINQLLSPLYIQDGICHGLIKVDKREGITANEWYELYSLIYSTVDNKDSIYIKSNVQSPGIIEFVSTNWATVGAVTIFLSGVIVGEVNICGFKFKGILPSIQSHKKSQVEIQQMDEDREAKSIANERARFELEKEKEIWQKEKEAESLRTRLQISNFDAGRKVEGRTQTGYPDVQDEDQL